jgi:methionine--tRNA ligase beta chain
MDTITIDDFIKIDLRAGKIIEASDFTESEKLLKLKVDFGQLGERKVLSGIKKWYKPEDLIGKTFIFCVNLYPRMIMSEESQAMILALEDEKKGKVILLTPKTKVTPGSKVH